MSRDDRGPFVSRAGEKLAAALDSFHIDVAGRVCADLGSHVGGFVDCLLTRGAAKVYSVDTAYGTLAWKLRRDPRVFVLERKNALHVTLPEPVAVVTIDVGWTKQAAVLANVARLIAGPNGAPATGAPGCEAAQALPLLQGGTEGGRSGGDVITLIKPHYEAPKELLVGGVLPDEQLAGVVDTVLAQIAAAGWLTIATCESPLRGHGGNREVFAHLRRSPHPSGPGLARGRSQVTRRGAVSADPGAWCNFHSGLVPQKTTRVRMAA